MSIAAPLSPRLPNESAPFLLAEEHVFDLNECEEFPLAALPPLKRPATHRTCQRVNGIAVVEGSCVGALTFAYTLAWFCGWEPTPYWTITLDFLLLQAVAAITLHFLVVCGDPGIVIRERATCLPLPTVVSERLRAGDSLDGLDNLTDRSADEGPPSTYCVRCCVWRPPPVSTASRASGRFAQWLWLNYPKHAGRWPCVGARAPHHCSVCQHCVVDFDHHCGVLGTCVAGGNMPFFIALVTVGQLAAVTDGICGLVAVYQIWGARAATWAIVCLGAYCLCGLSLAFGPYLCRMLLRSIMHRPAHARAPAYRVTPSPGRADVDADAGLDESPDA